MERLKLSAPITVFLNATNRCNLSCRFCSAAANTVKDELSNREMGLLLKRLAETRVLRVIVTGGELFLRRDIFQIIEKLCENHAVSILTNGTLIDDRIARKLASLRLNLSVSLDGPSSEVNDYLRGIGSFEKIIRGIKSLIKYDIAPNILFTPTKFNYQYFPVLVDMVKSLGIKHVGINELMPEGRCQTIYNDIKIPVNEAVRFKNTLRKLHQENPGVISENVAYWAEFPKLFKEVTSKGIYSQLKPKKLLPCSAAKDQIAITSDGWVIPCNSLTDIKCGNVREKDYIDIWKHSESMNEVRSLSSILTGEIPICRDCKYNVICSGGCRAKAYIVYQDLRAPNPDCPYFKKPIKKSGSENPRLVNDYKLS